MGRGREREGNKLSYEMNQESTGHQFSCKHFGYKEFKIWLFLKGTSTQKLRLSKLVLVCISVISKQGILQGIYGSVFRIIQEKVAYFCGMPHLWMRKVYVLNPHIQCPRSNKPIFQWMETSFPLSNLYESK